MAGQTHVYPRKAGISLRTRPLRPYTLFFLSSLYIVLFSHLVAFPCARCLALVSTRPRNR